MKYLKKKKVINKAKINGNIFFFPAAIGINKRNNTTKAIMDPVSIYIISTHYSKLTRLRLHYQLLYYNSLTKKSVPITHTIYLLYYNSLTKKSVPITHTIYLLRLLDRGTKHALYNSTILHKDQQGWGGTEGRGRGSGRDWKELKGDYLCGGEGTGRGLFIFIIFFNHFISFIYSIKIFI